MKWIITIIVIILVVGLGYYFYTKKYPSSNSSTNTQSSTPVVADTVWIKDFAFDPSSITIKAGDTVTFTNNDSTTHTITSSTFDSGDLAPGETFKETFDKAGTFDYHCSIHLSMTGKVIVQ